MGGTSSSGAPLCWGLFEKVLHVSAQGACPHPLSAAFGGLVSRTSMVVHHREGSVSMICDVCCLQPGVLEVMPRWRR